MISMKDILVNEMETFFFVKFLLCIFRKGKIKRGLCISSVKQNQISVKKQASFRSFVKQQGWWESVVWQNLHTNRWRTLPRRKKFAVKGRFHFKMLKLIKFNSRHGLKKNHKNTSNTRLYQLRLDLSLIKIYRCSNERASQQSNVI